MEEILTIEEINARFKDEWVLLEDPETDEQLRILRGKLLYHSKDRDELGRKAREVQPKHGAYLWVGALDDQVYLL